MSKATDKEQDQESKQRPVKRPAKPRGERFFVPRGVAWTHNKTTVRYLAGSEIVNDNTLTEKLKNEYLERGDIVAIDHKKGDK